MQGDGQAACLFLLDSRHLEASLRRIEHRLRGRNGWNRQAERGHRSSRMLGETDAPEQADGAAGDPLLYYAAAKTIGEDFN